MDAHAQVRSLLDEIRNICAAHGIKTCRLDELSDAVETISRAYMEPAPAVDWFGLYRLSKTEARLASILHRRLGQTLNQETLLDAMYFDNQKSLENVEDAANLMKVFICKTRKRLKPSPFEIITDRDVGYRMVLKPSAIAATALVELVA